MIAHATATCSALALWHAGESWAARPNYLAYFNAFAGGTPNGWRHLVDSSLDWGQDLPGLKTWLDAHAPGEKVFLAYFGTGDPAHEGIRATMLPSVPNFGPNPPRRALAAGVYAVSATMLQQVYGPTGGAWTPANEREYQELRAREPFFREFWEAPSIRDELQRLGTAKTFAQSWQRYDALRLARLTAYLRARQPEAMIGYSILIYRLSEAEVNAAVNGPYSVWLEAIAKIRDQD